MPENPIKKFCPSCFTVLPPEANFCPKCGMALKNNPPSISILKQITVYGVSLLLPPLGLWYVWKYLRQPDKKSKEIGVAALVLTIISLAITIWTAKIMLDSVNESLGTLNQLSF